MFMPQGYRECPTVAFSGTSSFSFSSVVCALGAYPPGPPGSGDDAHEALVQFPLIVEDRLADLIHRPHPLRVIGVIDEPTREHFIAVPRWIEEVDGLAACDAVPGRADVEGN